MTDRKKIPVRLLLQEQGLTKDIVLVLQFFIIPLKERGKLIQAIQDVIYLFKTKNPHG